jgi:predicted small secreted protein
MNTETPNIFIHLNFFKKENKMKLISTFLILAFAATLSACNTMAGAGQDIQKGGEKIEDAADKNK